MILDTFGPAPVDHDAARVAADWVFDSRAFMVTTPNQNGGRVVATTGPLTNRR
jgi:hypothetical protein